MRSLKERWNLANSKCSGCKFGLKIDDGDRLTNLRFADDVLLLATSRGGIKKMMSQLKAEAAKFGLQMHSGKQRS